MSWLSPYRYDLVHSRFKSIEPDYSALYVYSTLSGEFTMVNEHFVALAKENLVAELIDALKSVDGDVTALVDLW